MKVSRKRPTMDSQEKSNNNNSNKDKAMEEEEEQQQQQQQQEQQQEQDEENQEEEQQEEEEEEEEEQQQEAPRLEEGFYEMEAIRKRRVRKAQLQYLIKWRGWPESANTWEPIDNLQACSDVVDAFEERLQKSSRKRKRRGPYSSVGGGGGGGGAKNRRRDGPDPGSVVIGEDGGGKEVEGGDVMRVDDGGKGDEEKKEDGGFISIQLTGGPREEEGLVEDGLSKVDSVQPLQGAKKRKSGCVRRFKQDAVLPQGSGDGKGEKLGGEDVDWTEDDNAERQKVEEDGKPPYIAKLLRAVEFQASVTNNVQQVSIKFKALRSDGQEVLVDDKELKVKNPLLLISFYEQHLRYSPPTCDVNEQQS